MLITLPERRASMCAPTARVVSSASVRLMFKTNSSSSSLTPGLDSLPGRVTSGLRIESPSAFTSTSMRPNAASTSSTARRTLSGLVTSAMMGTTRRPDALAISAAVPSTYLGVSAFSATSAPACASTCGDPLADAAPGAGDEDDLTRDIEFRQHACTSWAETRTHIMYAAGVIAQRRSPSSGSIDGRA